MQLELASLWYWPTSKLETRPLPLSFEHALMGTVSLPWAQCPGGAHSKEWLRMYLCYLSK